MSSTRYNPDPTIWASEEAIQGTLNALREAGVEISDTGAWTTVGVHPGKMFLAYQVGHMAAGHNPPATYDEFINHLSTGIRGNHNREWLQSFGIEVPS